MQAASSNKTHYVTRAATLADAKLAAALFNRRSQKYYGQDQIQADALARHWESDDIVLNRDTQLFFCAANGDELVGYACVVDPRKPYVEITYQVAADPDADNDEALWDAMIEWCARKDSSVIDKSPEGVAVHARASALAEDVARCTAYERNGFRRVRVENHLRAELDRMPPEPIWPEGITLPPFDVERELPALVALDQEVFRDHWGHVERPFEEELRGWKEWIHSLGGDLDPALWFVARKDDELVGYAICEPSIAGDTTRAYVAGFGVRAAFRRRGIGLALLHHAFRILKERGRTAVELDMDSENLTGASRVYERAGMVPTRQMILYEKLLRDGTDITVRSLG